MKSVQFFPLILNFMFGIKILIALKLTESQNHLILILKYFFERKKIKLDLFFGKTLSPKQSQMEAAASRRQKAKFTSVKYRHDGII
jgi:hypothetical protein